MANIVWWIYMSSTVSIYSAWWIYIYTTLCIYTHQDFSLFAVSSKQSSRQYFSYCPISCNYRYLSSTFHQFPSRGETICRRSGESLPEVVRHSLWRSILLTFHPVPTGWLPKARTELFPIFINAFSIMHSFNMLLIVSKAYPLRKPDKLTATPGCEN